MEGLQGAEPKGQGAVCGQSHLRRTQGGVPYILPAEQLTSQSSEAKLSTPEEPISHQLQHPEFHLIASCPRRSTEITQKLRCLPVWAAEEPGRGGGSWLWSEPLEERSGVCPPYLATRSTIGHASGAHCQRAEGRNFWLSCEAEKKKGGTI